MPFEGQNREVVTDVINRPDAPPRAQAGTLPERAAADGVRFILATFVDLNGKPCAKLVPIEALAELEAGALGFAGFAAGAIGQKPQDPDICVIPDPDSYAALDFIKPGLAMVQCDPHVNGEPWPFAPRIILKNTLARLAATGATAMVGAEIEYFLLARDPDGSIHPADTRDSSGQPCYDARGVTRMYEHLATTSAAMNALGWGNYANDHEDGNGQFEQNFTFADALTTADRVITLRYIISMVAEAQGMTATFMPKPFANRAGNGMHLHLSLWNDGAPTFPNADDAHGLGLSETAYSFIAGVLDHAPALQAFIAPSVNSYKRSGARTTTSGATWSPQPRRLRRQRPDALHPGSRWQPHRAARRRRLGQPVPRDRGGARGWHVRDRARRESRCPERPRRTRNRRDEAPSDPAPRRAGAPHERAARRGVRTGGHRLLRRRQGGGVPHVAQHGHPVGDRPLPHRVLNPTRDLTPTIERSTPCAASRHCN